MQLIILEGTDGAGKSTLAEAISNEREVACVVHVGRPPESFQGGIVEYWHEVVKNLIYPHAQYDNRALFVWDRSFIGNYIYGKHKKDQKALTYKELIDLMKWLGTLFDRIDVFLLAAGNTAITRRLKTRGEQYVTAEEAIKIQDDYIEFFTDFAVSERPEKFNWYIHRARFNGARNELLKYVLHHTPEYEIK